MNITNQIKIQFDVTCFIDHMCRLKANLRLICNVVGCLEWRVCDAKAEPLETRRDQIEGYVCNHGHVSYWMTPIWYPSTRQDTFQVRISDKSSVPGSAVADPHK